MTTREKVDATSAVAPASPLRYLRSTLYCYTPASTAAKADRQRRDGPALSKHGLHSGRALRAYRFHRLLVRFQSSACG